MLALSDSEHGKQILQQIDFDEFRRYPVSEFEAARHYLDNSTNLTYEGSGH
jgi:hypothetical protein